MTAGQIVSVHFPKAGGTSLRCQFQAQFGESALFDYAHDPFMDASRAPLDLPADARLVHGHFHAARYAAPGRCLVTFLRDPVENLISIYFFWRFAPCSHALHERFLREKPSLPDFARHPAFRSLMTEQYFGCFDMRRFDFIGAHERRGEDIPRLGALLGLELSAEMHENRTQASAERDELASKPAIRAALRHILAAEIAFYERWTDAGQRRRFAWTVPGLLARLGRKAA